ncbi:zinc-dependent metalloprotease [Agromyces archimandritae]|uniref:Zinc-dependent metalloprotease n=1 Tax=Agromyces archimandritae TaxID=2781962 RepID=A0A975FRE5_9MICO|nr:zinc-dependent metalloprotease [Agromyces archimandritae]QTX06328.1 zinc-dependent metalloprotease [Agromyces archimandritae]
MLRELLSGQGGIDPSKLAGAAGLPGDPASLAAIFQQLQGAMNRADDGIDWSIALKQGEERAQAGQRQIGEAERAEYDRAFTLAALWLDEAVDVSSLPGTPELLTRRAWVAQTMPIWSQLAEPVALSISDSLTRVMSEQAPEELRGMIQGASRMMRAVGGTLFAMQLGQVVGQLSAEVVSGGDIGIPLLPDGRAAILPQNAAEFGDGLDIAASEVGLYLAVRELAHARLFRHARWLRLHLISSITEFARGISVDTARLEELAEDFDPSNPETLREAVVSGTLIRPKNAGQQAALARLETMLALVEGWVDVATAQATERLPRSGAIAETIRRRRASGGPAESAFATLVGLELRPRRLREAAELWRRITDAVGKEGRDALWAHPDLLPTGEDLDDPAGFVARVSGADAETNSADESFDQALEALLRGETAPLGDEDLPPRERPDDDESAGGPAR